MAKRIDSLIQPYEAMTAEQATERYGKIYVLLDAIYCDLPPHRYSLSDEEDAEAICSVPIQVGRTRCFINFYKFQPIV